LDECFLEVPVLFYHVLGFMLKFCGEEFLGLFDHFARFFHCFGLNLVYHLLGHFQEPFGLLVLISFDLFHVPLGVEARAVELAVVETIGRGLSARADQRHLLRMFCPACGFGSGIE
jgi:hypothetical protein